MEHEFHRELCHKIAMWLFPVCLDVYCGAPLPNSKIADVLAVLSDDTVLIVEVKSLFRPYYLQEAIDKYGRQCDQLAVAFPDIPEPLGSPMHVVGAFPSSVLSVGIITVGREGPRWERGATDRALSHAARQTIVVTVGRKK